jgi:hypothetical protein
MVLEWKQVHYYCSHLLAYFTSPGWQMMMMMIEEQFAEWLSGRGNRSTLRKTAPELLCPPQIPHDLTWTQTRAAAVGSQRLTI